jgi:hypothetical protein
MTTEVDVAVGAGTAVEGADVGVGGAAVLIADISRVLGGMGLTKIDVLPGSEPEQPTTNASTEKTPAAIPKVRLALKGSLQSLGGVAGRG